MTDTFREGIRSGNPNDECPGCHTRGVILAMDFKKFGRHNIRVCLACHAVFDHGELLGGIEVWK